MEDVEAAQMPWRPLGEVLVEKGLITDGELDSALAEQELTGRRLGEILIARGFVSGPALTMALADQFGVEVETESGYGSGLWAEIARRHDRGLGRDSGDPAPAGTGSQPGVRQRIGDYVEGAPGAGVYPSVPAGPARPGPDAGLAELWGRLEELNARLSATEARLAEETAARLEAENELAEVLTGRGQPHSSGAEPALRLPARFVLFVPLADRYELVEQEGPLPAPGSEVELGALGESRFTVSKVGRSPLPADTRPCAYLQAA